MTTMLDDLVALLLQGQAPFGDEEFIAAAHTYRQNMPGGSTSRLQVTLAACLYLQVKKVRIAEPAVRALGAWGNRNDMLADIAAFQRGRMPVTSAPVAGALRQLGGPPADILQIAVSQGLEAAQRAMEEALRAEFERRLNEAQDLANRRVRDAERRVIEATGLKEAAQAQAQLLEEKFEQSITQEIELSAAAAAAAARAEELATQVHGLTTALETANARLAASQDNSAQLQQRLQTLEERREVERKEGLLALDRARTGQANLLASQQAEIARLGKLLENAQTELTGANAQAQGHAAEAAGMRVALDRAQESIKDLQVQLYAATERAAGADVRAAQIQEVGTVATALAESLRLLRNEMVTTADMLRFEALVRELRDPIDGTAADGKK